MKDVAKHPWLWERKEKNGTRMFCLRARVPKESLDIYGREQIKKSLRTQDTRKANRLINTEAALLEEEFEAHRRKKARVKKCEVTKAELWVLAKKWFREHDEADLDAWQYREEWEREQARDIVCDDLGAIAKLDDPHVYQEFANEADVLLDRKGIALDPASWL